MGIPTNPYEFKKAKQNPCLAFFAANIIILPLMSLLFK